MYTHHQKQRRQNNQPEFHLQVAVVLWLQTQFRETLFTISPAGLKMSKFLALKMKRMGYRRGTPDLLIFEPRGQYKGLFVELKADRPGRNPEQEEFLRALNERGYYAVECVGFDAAVRTINNYLRIDAIKNMEIEQ